MIVNRISAAVDPLLSRVEAGFRKGKSCNSQIFTLRQTLVQCHQWDTYVYTNFIDFLRAFDILNREFIWAIPRYYRNPTKIVSIIQLLYSDLKFKVICGSCLPEEFEVNTEVKHGCILCSLLFSLGMDWLMRETMQGGQREKEVLIGL